MATAPDLRARIERFFSSGEGADVISAYLFGSQAEGRAHAESDVDVAMVLDLSTLGSPRRRFERRLEIGSGLISALHENEVDVVVLNEAPPLFARRVLLEGERLWCADAESDRTFRRDVLLRAADLAPFLEKFARRKLEALAR